MSETAKWQIHTGDSLRYRNGESWFTKPNGDEVDLFDIPATLNSLETSLAEAQKEREALVADKPFALWPRWVDEARSRAEAAEQQLAEVKAQLDAQAGVIRVAQTHYERVMAKRRVTGDEMEEMLAQFLGDYEDALAHVREPETK